LDSLELSFEDFWAHYKTKARCHRLDCTALKINCTLQTDRLLADAEPTDQLAVAIGILALEVIQQAAALANQTEQATTGMVVFHVHFEVLGEFINAVGQKRDLNFGRAGIGGGPLVVTYNLRFLGSVGSHAILQNISIGKQSPALYA
jgi:hypothetical protein